MTESLADPTWVPVQTSRTPEGEADYGLYEGTGRRMTVYVDDGVDAGFFLVGAN